MTVRNFLNCSENIYRALSTKIMEMKALLFTETMDQQLPRSFYHDIMISQAWKTKIKLNLQAVNKPTFIF